MGMKEGGGEDTALQLWTLASLRRGTPGAERSLRIGEALLSSERVGLLHYSREGERRKSRGRPPAAVLGSFSLLLRGEQEPRATHGVRGRKSFKAAMEPCT